MAHLRLTLAKRVANKPNPKTIAGCQKSLELLRMAHVAERPMRDTKNMSKLHGHGHQIHEHMST